MSIPNVIKHKQTTNMDIDQAALTKVLKLFDVKELKKEQSEIINSLFHKRDCIAVLPTGFGKSLPFQLYLLLKREMTRMSSDEKVIVCSPLLALMQDQVAKLRSIKGMNTGYKGKYYIYIYHYCIII